MSSFVDGLVPRIRQILGSSDLSTVSAKAVRKQLIADGEDADAIKANRGEIDELIGRIYEELAPGESTESESEEEAPLAAAAAPPPKKPKVKPERNQVEADAAMAARMQAEYDAATRGGGRGERRAAAPAPKKKSAAKKSSSGKVNKRSNSDIEDSDEEGGKKKRKGGGGGAFNKELILSDALSSFLHEQRLSRPQTVKRIWEYIKANDLQDPNDRRFILCDAQMQTVFHTDKLHMFTMNKLLVPHFRDPDEVV